jgi:hypothetical protein
MAAFPVNPTTAGATVERRVGLLYKVRHASGNVLFVRGDDRLVAPQAPRKRPHVLKRDGASADNLGQLFHGVVVLKKQGLNRPGHPERALRPRQKNSTRVNVLRKAPLWKVGFKKCVEPHQPEPLGQPAQGFFRCERWVHAAL